MRRTLADSILKAYRETAKKHLPPELKDNHRVALLVNFSLGDLRALEQTIEEVDSFRSKTNAA